MAIHHHGAAASATQGRGLVIALAGCLLAVALITPPAGAQPTAPADQAADTATAASVATEARRHAGGMGAATVVASHFADGADSHHYPASPGDGPQKAVGHDVNIAANMARFAQGIPDFRLDEVVSQHGPVITITSLISGTDPATGQFHDTAVTSYRFGGGKVVHVDSIHINPGASVRGPMGAQISAADHATAIRFADEMRATGGEAMLAAPAHFAEMVAVLSKDADHNALLPRDRLAQIITGEEAALKAALSNYASHETITAEGNRIILDNKTTGTLKSGEATWADTHAVFHVTRGVIVGVEATHSPEAQANLKKVFPKAG